MTFIPNVLSKPSITREVTIQPTVCEIAQAFSDMDAAEQALFFHEVALVFRSWGSYRRDTQFLSIAERFNKEGLAADFVRELYEAIAPTALACTEEGAKR